MRQPQNARCGRSTHATSPRRRVESAPYKRLVMIGEGTHSVIMEKNRMQLFREVQLFLDEPPPAKPGKMYQTASR
jgi:hypothetical protein